MATDTPRRALIIGAGPGGLSAAIALQRVGIEATVFERVRALGTVGGGLGVQSNAIRALRRIGVGDRLVAAGSEVRVNEIRNSAGKLLFELPQGEVADEYGAPTIMVPRAEVQLALADQLPNGALQLDAECVGVEQDADGVTAHLADGRAERGALLIGADGGYSLVRKHVYGDAEQPLRYAGMASWRAIVELEDADEVVPEGPAQYYSGDGTQFVVFRAGGRRVYWGLLNTEPAGGKDPPEGVREALCEIVREFPEVTRRLIRATSERSLVRTDLYDRDPVQNWTRGRVVLLGDAAHLTTPFIGQGAGISMEDSIVIAKELALTDGLRDERMLGVALESYQRRRAPRCAKVVLSSRRRGKVYMISNPMLTRLRDVALPLVPHFATRVMVKRSIIYDV
jgi:2-polyprenyl-6-methoxyphenol hydroxylase-like FAD-dependent oxidoreductase